MKIVSLTVLAALLALSASAHAQSPTTGTLLVDDFSRSDGLTALGTQWRNFTDQVMGGISTQQVTRETIAGRPALRLRGDVRLENNGGFVMVRADLAPAGRPLDAGDYKGVRITARGNGETYYVHLRTTSLLFPWQFYAAPFQTTDEWQTIDLPFADFAPESTRARFNPRRLTSIAVVGMKKAFQADVAVARLEFYR
ncbi:MAG: CIA30 family protein [Candidatus Sumerlaeaceae bacterium]|nr:CIA30 family protein [Candidatus Sumerlaeaceae bacterium]